MSVLSNTSTAISILHLQVLESTLERPSQNEAKTEQNPTFPTFDIVKNPCRFLTLEFNFCKLKKLKNHEFDFLQAKKR